MKQKNGNLWSKYSSSTGCQFSSLEYLLQYDSYLEHKNEAKSCSRMNFVGCKCAQCDEMFVKKQQLKVHT